MITVDTLTKTYGSRRAVDGLSFTVTGGRVTGFVGPNGSGKSTTMRMMVGLTRPDSGNVAYNGHPYQSLPQPARTIGVALDAAAHPGRSARNHLRTLAAASAIPAERVDVVLDEVGMTTAAGERVGGFSLGMRQRLALAGALLGEPETLMLDEPANGLDPDGIRWLRTFLRSYADRGGAVFVSSHLIGELAMFADDIVVIGAGRLLAAAPIETIAGAATSAVIVETNQMDRFELLLQQNGLIAERDSGRLSIAGADRTAVAQLALDHQIRLDELTDHQASLEDVLVDLTHSSAEFASA
ncbi:MAG: ATP-binding cassette domain-containing protein [Acidimicrobiales bacterium]